MNRGKSLARGEGPKRSRPLLPCGPGWLTQEKAEEAAGDAGREVFRCLNRACGKWHLRDAPRPRAIVSPAAPVRPQRARRDTDPPRSARLAVAARSGGICERCRKARAVHVHHRQPKQAGGTRRRLAHALFNLLHVCFRCHAEIHGDPAKSYKAGWLVLSGGDPALVPLRTRTARGEPLTEWLTADGRRTTEMPEAAA